MSKRTKIGCWIIVAVSVFAVALFAAARYQLKRWYLEENPIIWLPEIRAFEAQDREQGIQENAFVFVGSSSIRLWDSLTDDMAPLPVVRRGFGGARLADVTHYVERIVAPYKPLAVVLFAGTNDIVPGRSKTPQEILVRFQAFVSQVWHHQPDTPIFYIAITPSPSRWSVWPIARESNRLIRDYVDSRDQLHFIDTSARLLGGDGQPRPELYRADGLHLSEAGYRLWSDEIQPRLNAWAAQYEIPDHNTN